MLRFRRRLRSWTIPLISADTFLLPDTNPGPLGDWIRRAFDIQSSLLPQRLRGRFHHTPPPDRSSALRFNFPPLHFHPALVSRPAAAGLLLLWHGAIVAAICIGSLSHSHQLGQKAVVSVMDLQLDLQSKVHLKTSYVSQPSIRHIHTCCCQCGF